jgi:hypothetical protein
MLALMCGAIAVISSPIQQPARDARAVLRSAVEWLSTQKTWSASITIDHSGDAPFNNRSIRSGTLLAIAPGSFELTLTKEQPDGINKPYTLSGSKVPRISDDAPNQWTSIRSDGNWVAAERSELSDEAPYRAPHEYASWFVGDIPVLMMWLDREVIEKLSKSGFQVAHDGFSFVDSDLCAVVRIARGAQSVPEPTITLHLLDPAAKDARSMDSLRLFVDRSGRIRRTIALGSWGRTTVTFSNVAPGARQKIQPVEPLANWLGPKPMALPWEFGAFWWADRTN